MSWTKKYNFEVEEHPFDNFIPLNSKYLILGTFPTHKSNSRFNFYYSGQHNNFWKIIEKVYNISFKHNEGNKAIEERKKVLELNRIGITDMHQKCYRNNKYSTDENLFPIILNDIFSLLDAQVSIKTIVLTSRSEIFGALGLLKTYFLQKGLVLEQPEKRLDKILKGSFLYNKREIEILVPYSPSPRLIEKGKTTLDELIKMYKYCLTS